MKILVIGSANIDLVARVARIPKAGESLMGTSFSTSPGGKGANQAVASARLGAETWFAGCVGADEFGDTLTRSLAAAGVRLDYLKVTRDSPTGAAMIFVTDSGENAIAVVPSANVRLTPQDIDRLEPMMRSADAVLIQLEIPIETVTYALQLARRHKILSVLDAGPVRNFSRTVIGLADILTPNETEAEEIAGIPVVDVPSAVAAANRLRAMGAREIVLKLGARGALYCGDETLHVPAFAIDPVDTVGAGDAFTAALALTWNSLDRHDALRFANAAGALAALTSGAQAAMPTRAELDAFVAGRKREAGGIARV